MKYLKRCMAMLLAILMMLTLFACTEKQETTALRVALAGEIHTLDPAEAQTQAEKTAVVHIRENLMKTGSTGVLPGMAKSYQCEDNLDGTETYTFKLRDDIRWTNGEKVTAGDFVYAWCRLVSPKNNFADASILNMVDGYRKVQNGEKTSALQVKAKDDETLVVKLNCHCPYFVSSVCTAVATMPVSKEDPAMTNGLYTVEKQEDNQLALRLSHQYYDDKSMGTDKITFILTKSDEETAEYYDDGEAEAVIGLSREAIEKEPNTWAADDGRSVGVLLINQMNERLRNKALRQAMTLTINRSAIAELLGERSYLPAEGLVPHGIAATQEGDYRELTGALIDNSDYELSCAAAKDLDVDVSKLGTLTLRYEDTPAMTQVAGAIADGWKEQLGLTVSLKPVTRDALQTALDKGEFTMALMELDAKCNDASGFLSRWESGADGNYAMFHSSAYNMLMRVVRASSSAEARDAYLADAERLLLEKGNVIPLYFTTQTAQLSDQWTGMYCDGMGVYHFESVHHSES